MAPGLASPGRRFGFERWPSFGDGEKRVWQNLIDEARAAMLPKAPAPIVGSDRDPDAVAAARRNAGQAAAPASASIEWRIADVRELEAGSGPPSVVVTNPPYGERLGTPDKTMQSFWRIFGGRLKAMNGHVAFVLGTDAVVRSLGMRPTWDRKLRNGPLAVSLCRYELGGRRR